MGTRLQIKLQDCLLVSFTLCFMTVGWANAETGPLPKSLHEAADEVRNTPGLTMDEKIERIALLYFDHEIAALPPELREKGRDLVGKSAKKCWP
jgi:hypothetical protein